ncbi:MAG: hypothetical protein WDN10_00480 [bacterium]
MDHTTFPPVPKEHHPRFVKWAVVIGIVVVLNVFFVVLISLVLPSPQYADFCPQAQVVPTYDTEASCTKAGGQWTATPNNLTEPTEAKQPKVIGYCNPDYSCNQKFTADSSEHERNAFIALVALGVVALIAGVFVPGSSIVSSGLAYGGVLSFVIASVSYWGDAGSWIRLGISLIALIALLYIGLKRFKD